ncbi:putative phosphoesterase [Caldicoprobacter guelmensis]|uniref:metallophosphoesterase n=1 Tax=Caldicoprobacter guelmensis TaxID=1170224 RepID=UPI001958E008|nr:metallophosphoesterase [Caldicoprobacter guelmensis]MBM7581995.1 putative phosphoesterase [Caldicoprobacter guelmensis]
MRIGVISDSHGKRFAIDRALKSIGEVDMLIHLGDLCSDALYMEKSLEVPVVYVRGNCDFSGQAPYSREIEVKGKLIFLTHGHLYRVKWGTSYIVDFASKNGFDVVLFGHTHVPEVFWEDNIVFMNPGSVSLPRGGASPSAGVIEVADDKILPYIVKI